MVRSSQEWQRFNDGVVAEFRANEGRVGAFGDLPLVVLHTIGARSGMVREIPLIPVERGDDVLFYGTAEGSRTDPAWVHNLRAHPRITVEAGDGRFDATFEELALQEADAIVAEHSRSTPVLADYVASAAPRPIPVFRMHRV